MKYTVEVTTTYTMVETIEVEADNGVVACEAALEESQWEWSDAHLDEHSACIVDECDASEGEP